LVDTGIDLAQNHHKAPLHGTPARFRNQDVRALDGHCEGGIGPKRPCPSAMRRRMPKHAQWYRCARVQTSHHLVGIWFSQTETYGVHIACNMFVSKKDLGAAPENLLHCFIDSYLRTLVWWLFVWRRSFIAAGTWPIRAIGAGGIGEGNRPHALAHARIHASTHTHMQFTIPYMHMATHYARTHTQTHTHTNPHTHTCTIVSVCSG